MTARKTITPAQKIASLRQWGRIICTICGEDITPTDDIDFDHIKPVAFGGTNEADNLRPVHRACHKTKTFGSPATTAGSDIHGIRKAERIARGGKKRRGRSISSRPLGNGRWKRKINGEVERRDE